MYTYVLEVQHIKAVPSHQGNQEKSMTSITRLIFLRNLGSFSLSVVSVRLTWYSLLHVHEIPSEV